jgi:hypothetical protein
MWNDKDDEWLIGKDLEGSSRDLIEVLSGIFLEVLRNTMKNLGIGAVPAEIRTKHVSNERYR